MKIFSAVQIRAWDAYTIANEPIPSIDLMERASLAFTNWFTSKYDQQNSIAIFCGIGNNGGDGLAIGRMLLGKGYKVQVYTVRFAPKVSHDFAVNFERLSSISPILDIEKKEDIPDVSGFSILIDGVFGSGLSRPAEGIALSVIRSMNRSGTEVVSIDVASGLYCDEATPNIEDKVAHPNYTVSFQVPKLGFLLPENIKAVGEWSSVSIGLHSEYYQKTNTDIEYVDSDFIQKLHQPREKFSHKGTFGHALLLAGSYGKIGAAILSAKAILRVGAGLLTTYLPTCGYSIMQSVVPEAMCLVDEDEQIITKTPSLEKYASVGIGPGLGKAPSTLQALTSLLNQPDLPRLVVDADAINLIAQNSALLEKTPADTVFTPHPKEFERLVGKSLNNFERLEKLKRFCREYKAYVVLKGAHSAIGTPEGKIYFNSTGNAGMATAGSGDILTGIITGLLSQPYSVKDAVILGVFLHGLAGDLALESQSTESLIASDITENLGKAFNQIRNERVS